ncbi:hypothetical protein RRF57_011120 [Xylaria bambusicola]|uniref:Uncharacterized protein n=1 Tax=Xylaria bambusicola TaxID=326684 RepID=A0AAN7ZDR5_9PEZI
MTASAATSAIHRPSTKVISKSPSNSSISSRIFSQRIADVEIKDNRFCAYRYVIASAAVRQG